MDGIKLNNVECTYSAEGTKEEYSEITDKIVAANKKIKVIDYGDGDQEREVYYNYYLQKPNGRKIFIINKGTFNPLTLAIFNNAFLDVVVFNCVF